MRSRALRHRAVATISACAWAVLCAASPEAHAQAPRGSEIPDGGSPNASPRAGDRTLEVTVIGGGDDAEPLMDTIRELVGRLGFEVSPHFSAAATDAGAPLGPPLGMRVAVDLGSRYEATLVVRSGRTEIRRSIPRDGSPAVVREEIGEAVRSTVESQLLIDEAPAAVVRAQPAYVRTTPPSPAAAPDGGVATATASPGIALDVTTFAGVGPVADGSGAVPHIGGGLTLGWRRGRRPSLSLTGAYLAEFETGNPDVQAHTMIVALRAVAALEVLHLRRFALDIGAGGGVDVVRLSVTTASSITAVPTTQVDGVVTGLLTGYVALAPGVAITVIAGAEWDVAPPEYYEQLQGTRDVLKPWYVRPVALAGFTFTALGGGLFQESPR